MEITLKKALRDGLIDLRGVPMAAMVEIQSLPHWVSDERKLSRNRQAIFLVVEAPDDESAAALREPWPGLVVLRDGWFTEAHCGDHMPGRTFTLSAFKWEPVRYGGDGPYRLSEGVIIHGSLVRRAVPRFDELSLWRAVAMRSFKAEMTLPKSWSQRFNVTMPKRQKRDLPPVEIYLEFVPETGAHAITNVNQAHYADVFPEHVAQVVRWAIEGQRRAALHPGGDARFDWK